MGPGGPRGLQILRLGASRVRGGFDSHAFPPRIRAFPLAIAVAGLGVLVALGPGQAAERAAEDVPVEADTVAVDSLVMEGESVVVPDTSEFSPRVTGEVVTPAAGPVSRFDRPKYVMYRSLILPGWGQIHNRSWLKAGAVIAGEGYLGYRIYQDRQDIEELERLAAEAGSRGETELQAVLLEQHNALVDETISRQWILGGVIALALVDAYVDAHFKNFRIEFDTDPALPKGESAPLKMRFLLKARF